ncbi:MAG: NAD(P)-dependent oxidoreductase [Patescibacteria group bacterium]
MAKKVLIFGSAGMLGRELIEHLSGFPDFNIFGADKNDVDIVSYDSVFKIIKKYNPDFVINCAALINVEYCEANPLEAYKVNSIGPGNIAKALGNAKLPNSKFIQISTSDVFGGEKKFFKESDSPKPVNIYSQSKFFGEKILEQESKIYSLKYFIVRTNWLYSKHRKTFVDFIYENLRDKKQIDVISDQYGVVTWAKDLATSIVDLMDGSAKYENGIYHLVSHFDRRLSRFDIAKEIANIAKAGHKHLKPSKRADVFKVPRPKSVVLVNSKLPRMPDWKKSLKKFLLTKLS